MPRYSDSQGDEYAAGRRMTVINAGSQPAAREAAGEQDQEEVPGAADGDDHDDMPVEVTIDEAGPDAPRVSQQASAGRRSYVSPGDMTVVRRPKD